MTSAARANPTANGVLAKIDRRKPMAGCAVFAEEFRCAEPIT
jgi:hypothetical protein